MDYITFPFEKFVTCITTEYDVQADSILALYIEIAKYLRDNPIVSGLTVKEIIDRYLEENPPSAGVVSVNGKTGVVTGLYDADNPPPYPVTSVNGKTGAVVIEGGGGVSGVTSVNDKTGDVKLKVVDVVNGVSQDNNSYIFIDESENPVNIVDIVYPIGSIYMNLNNVSPSVLFGGEWASINGRFLIGTGAPELNDDSTSPGSYNFAADSKGGESSHALTINELAAHYHNGYVLGLGGSTVAPAYFCSLNQSAYTYNYAGTTPNAETVAMTSRNGSGVPHNNMPPYLAVYMWKRIS